MIFFNGIINVPASHPIISNIDTYNKCIHSYINTKCNINLQYAPVAGHKYMVYSFSYSGAIIYLIVQHDRLIVQLRQYEARYDIFVCLLMLQVLEIMIGDDFEGYISFSTYDLLAAA